MYLLDTVVLSELRRRERNPGVVNRLASQRSSGLFLSAVTIGEIERGILLQQTKKRPVCIDLGGMVGNDPASAR